MPGTLTLPTGAGPVPAVVLVHGSGPNDRDETIGPNKPFKDLAFGLATRGIAVLRYDKRTRVYAGRLQGGGIDLDDEVVYDALAAVALARTRPEIDRDRVVLLGHSLGGLLAPEIARRDGALAGVVLLAAPARRFTTVLREQLHYIASLPRAGEAERAATDSLVALIDAFEVGVLPDTASILGAHVPYLRALDGVEPVPALRGLDVPALVLQGGRDYQVTLADLALWEAGLAGRPHTVTKAFPALNHLFASGEGMATPAEYMSVSAHVAAEVVEEIAGWIVRLPPRGGR